MSVSSKIASSTKTTSSINTASRNREVLLLGDRFIVVSSLTVSSCTIISGIRILWLLLFLVVASGVYMLSILCVVVEPWSTLQFQKGSSPSSARVEACVKQQSACSFAVVIFDSILQKPNGRDVINKTSSVLDKRTSSTHLHAP